jgi:putative methyltransferase (TIGR04325 family)
MAEERGARQLLFSYDFMDGDDSEVFLVSGCLHFIETPLASQLLQLKKPPQHLLINRIPLIDGPETVTIQDIGEALLPCVIRNRQEFVRSIERAGYRLHDSWNIADKQCTLPLYPDRSAYSYSGFYFRPDSCLG